MPRSSTEWWRAFRNRLIEIRLVRDKRRSPSTDLELLVLPERTWPCGRSGTVGGEKSWRFASGRRPNQSLRCMSYVEPP
jgi:hypothetical protein